MAEKTVLVCDVCGKPAAQSVTFRVGGRNRVKDFCEQHVADLLKGSRAPRRGRPVGNTVKKSARKRPAGRKRTAKRKS